MAESEIREMRYEQKSFPRIPSLFVTSDGRLSICSTMASTII